MIKTPLTLILIAILAWILLVFVQSATAGERSYCEQPYPSPTVNPSPSPSPIPQVEPSPTPSPNNPVNPSTITSGDGGHPVNICEAHEEAPNALYHVSAYRQDFDTVCFNWELSSEVNHYFLSYGHSYADTPYGLQNIGGDSMGVCINEVWNSYVYANIYAEGDNHCARKVEIDP